MILCEFIKPVTVTDSVLVSSSIAETDYAAYASGTTYAKGAKVIRTSTHRIYESLVDTNAGNTPESSPTKWADIGPTNRWAMFDQSVGTQTTGTTSISVVIAPGLINSLALLNLSGVNSVSCVMTSGGSTVYSSTQTMGDRTFIDNYFDYFFSDFDPSTEALFLDLPPYADGQITITATGSGSVGIGVLSVGNLKVIGQTLGNPRISIVDYSKKETDEYGVTTFVERAYSKRMEVPVLIDGSRVDYVFRELATVRAKPVVYIGAGDKFQSMIILGKYNDLTIDIPRMNSAESTLTIEGLT